MSPVQRHQFSTTTPNEINPDYIANTDKKESTTYILTLLTDADLHQSMTDLRSRYFPKELNKLAAHLTLFHALPGSKLESDVLPTLQHLCDEYGSFGLHANRVFRLKKGIGIGVEDSDHPNGCAHAIHKDLHQKWKSFLSKQDLGGESGGVKLHYTIMNKVEDEKQVEKSMVEVRKDFKPIKGTVDGLSLYKYDKGYWVQGTHFKFNKKN